MPRAHARASARDAGEGQRGKVHARSCEMRNAAETGRDLKRDRARVRVAQFRLINYSHAWRPRLAREKKTEKKERTEWNRGGHSAIKWGAGMKSDHRACERRDGRFSDALRGNRFQKDSVSLIASPAHMRRLLAANLQIRASSKVNRNTRLSPVFIVVFRSGAKRPQAYKFIRDSS